MVKRLSMEQVVSLTGDIYEIANGQQDWTTFLDRIRRILDGSRACIQRFDGRGMPLESESTAREEASFAGELLSRGLDPVTPLSVALLSMQPGTIYHEHTYVDLPGWRRSQLWNELMAPREMYGGIGCRLGGTPGESDWWILDVQRGRGQPAFDREELRLLRLLAPALGRAMAMVGSPSTSLDSQVFDRLPTALVVVSQDVRVLRMNMAAGMLVERHGLALSHGVLRTGSTATTRILHDLVAAACRAVGDVPAGAGDMIVENGAAGCGGLIVSVVPMFSGKSAARPERACAALYLRETATTVDTGFSRRAAHLFGLTAREGEVALHLVNGLSVRQIADEGGISVTTVRTHVGNLFRKTGTRRQSQLVSVLGRLSDAGRYH